MEKRPARWGSDASKGMNQASRGLAMAFGCVGIILLFFGAGKLVDDWLGIKPWVEVIGSIAGWAAATYVVYQGTRRGL
ncbi:MAG: AtpZ/AtpI family protein [Actinomycetota bacterium]|nr:AtpZ/AtpI family protein [Actinomycetota bacterium]